VSQDYVKVGRKLFKAASRLIKLLSTVEYIKVTIKWSKHRELGRCSVDVQRKAVTFTFKVPLEGMTTEDLAVSCIEALASTARSALAGAAAVLFIAAAAAWYILPPTVPDVVRSATSVAIAAAAIALVIIAGLSLLKHERELRTLKEYYIKLARADEASMRTYSMIVDVISEMLKACRGKSKVVIKSSKILGFLYSNYGDVVKRCKESAAPK